MSVCPLHLVFPFIFHQAGRLLLDAMNTKALILCINTQGVRHVCANTNQNTNALLSLGCGRQ